jgi:hypothetical protein
MCDHAPTSPDNVRKQFIAATSYTAAGLRRQTVAQRSDRSAAYWVKMRWANQSFWELHLHFKKGTSVNWDHTKIKCRTCQAYVALPSSEDSNRAVSTAKRSIPEGYQEYD